MSAVIEWLFEKTPDETDPAPRTALLDGKQNLPPADDDLGNDPAAKVELEPVFVVIDYADAYGTTSRRRITLRHVSSGPKAPLLTAFCHERNAPRTFRTDRIICFLEDTGEAVECAVFFRETMLMDISQLDPGEAQVALNNARGIRDGLRSGLSILVAVARSDEHFEPSELDEILIWAQESWPGMSSSDCQALRKLVQKMRPARNSLRGYIERLNTDWLSNDDRRRRFHRALLNVVIADGVFHPEEEDLLNDLCIILD